MKWGGETLPLDLYFGEEAIPKFSGILVTACQYFFSRKIIFPCLCHKLMLHLNMCILLSLICFYIRRVEALTVETLVRRWRRRRGSMWINRWGNLLHEKYSSVVSENVTPPPHPWIRFPSLLGQERIVLAAGSVSNAAASLDGSQAASSRRWGFGASNTTWRFQAGEMSIFIIKGSRQVHQKSSNDSEKAVWEIKA